MTSRVRVHAFGNILPYFKIRPPRLAVRLARFSCWGGECWGSAVAVYAVSQGIAGGGWLGGLGHCQADSLAVVLGAAVEPYCQVVFLARLLAAGWGEGRSRDENENA